MPTIKEMREEYKRIETIITSKLKAKDLSLAEFLADYRLGRSNESLRMKYKLRDEELNHIYNNYITGRDRKVRQENIEKFNETYNMMGLSKSQRDKKQKDESQVTVPENLKESIEAVLDAIKNVEVGGEEK